MKFDETNFFILYPNPKVSAKILRSTASSYWWYEAPSNILHIWHSKFIKGVNKIIFEGALNFSLWNNLRSFLDPIIQISMNVCHRDPKTWQDHLIGSGGAQFTNPQFGPKTNSHPPINNTTQHRIPLEGNPSNRLKEPHLQVKYLSERSILHWNHIHPCTFIHPCFQVISLTLTKILHRIRCLLGGTTTRLLWNWMELFLRLNTQELSL